MNLQKVLILISLIATFAQICCAARSFLSALSIEAAPLDSGEAEFTRRNAIRLSIVIVAAQAVLVPLDWHLSVSRMFVISDAVLAALVALVTLSRAILHGARLAVKERNHWA